MTKTYTTISGDQWDVISLKVYGSEQFVSELIEANYTLRDVVFFSAGQVITVPTVTQAQRNDINTPPWRRGQ
jgi:phage tail protein X